MIETDLTLRALALAREAHRFQKDKGGAPYILHPIAVAQSMTDEISTAAALLHDVMEDCAPEYALRIRAEFPPSVWQAVDALTRRSGVSYEDYVAAAAQNPVARRVKIADLRHNLDASRLPEALRDSPRERLRRQKYARALEFLCALENSEVQP